VRQMTRFSNEKIKARLHDGAGGAPRWRAVSPSRIALLRKQRKTVTLSWS
jgi:hypothetical protein